MLAAAGRLPREPWYSPRAEWQTHRATDTDIRTHTQHEREHILRQTSFGADLVVESEDVVLVLLRENIRAADSAASLGDAVRKGPHLRVRCDRISRDVEFRAGTCQQQGKRQHEEESFSNQRALPL